MSADNDLAALVTAASRDFDGLVLRAVPRVRNQISGPHAVYSISDEELTRAMTAVLREILTALGGESSTDTDSLDAVIRRRFNQGVALLDLLHNYRVGAAAIWEELFGLIAEEIAAYKSLLIATPHVFEIVDHFSLRAHQIYRELTINTARRQEQVRATFLDILLTGAPEDGETYWDAAVALGVPRRGHFLIVDATAQSAVATETDWERIVADSPDVESAWFRLGPRSQVGLIALRSEHADAERLGRQLYERASATVGLSAPFTSVADCRTARAQAGTAAAATSSGHPVVCYDRDVLDVLMASSPAAATSLVQATLGPVLALPSDRARVLIENVSVWLDHQQSIAATAAATHCHRNTVNYRLRRFEEVSGHLLSDNTWLAQVYLAVNYVTAARTAELSSGSAQGNAGRASPVST